MYQRDKISFRQFILIEWINAAFIGLATVVNFIWGGWSAVVLGLCLYPFALIIAKWLSERA